MKVHAKNIEWDNEVDGGYEDVSNLPTEVEVDLEVVVDSDWNEDDILDAIGDALCNYLSDTYGYAVSSVEWDNV